MKKFLYLLLLLVGFSTVTVSCSDDNDDPYSGNWFNKKEFTAEPENWGDDSYIDWWILSMDGNGGSGYDGRFTVRAYNDDGSLVRGANSYSGKYTVDFEQGRLYVTYDGYSANAVWNFGDEEYQGWPNWNPNRYIQIPSTELGELAGLTFYSGNVFKDPNYNE